MLSLEAFVNFVSKKPIISMPSLAFMILLLVPLAGCTNDGAGGPLVSSLTTPTDETTGLDSDQELSSQSADTRHEEDPKITMTSTSTGVTASLSWDRPSDFNVTGYTIYYGKRPPQEEAFSEESDLEESSTQESEPSACSKGESQNVGAPPATITGLEPNTEYFFVIRAFNEASSESLCSTEITAVTPLAHS